MKNSSDTGLPVTHVAHGLTVIRIFATHT